MPRPRLLHKRQRTRQLNSLFQLFQEFLGPLPAPIERSIVDNQFLQPLRHDYVPVHEKGTSVMAVLEIRYVSPVRLRPYADNAWEHSRKQLKLTYRR